MNDGVGTGVICLLQLVSLTGRKAMTVAPVKKGYYNERYYTDDYKK